MYNNLMGIILITFLLWISSLAAIFWILQSSSKQSQAILKEFVRETSLQIHNSYASIEDQNKQQILTNDEYNKQQKQISNKLNILSNEMNGLAQNIKRNSTSAKLKINNKLNNKLNKKIDEYINVINDKIMTAFNKPKQSASSKAEKKANKKDFTVDIKKLTDNFDGISLKIENILKILKLEKNYDESFKKINKKFTFIEKMHKEHKEKHSIVNKKLCQLERTLSKLYNIKHKNKVNENITVDNEKLNKSLNIILKKLNTIVNIMNAQSIKCILDENKKEINNSLGIIDNKINILVKHKNESVEPINVGNTTDKVIILKNKFNEESNLNNNRGKQENINDELYNSQLLIKNILNEQINGLKYKRNKLNYYENIMKKENNSLTPYMLTEYEDDIIDVKDGIKEKVNIITTFFRKQFIFEQSQFEEMINKANMLIYEIENKEESIRNDETLASYGY